MRGFRVDFSQVGSCTKQVKCLLPRRKPLVVVVVVVYLTRLQAFQEVVIFFLFFFLFYIILRKENPVFARPTHDSKNTCPFT